MKFYIYDGATGEILSANEAVDGMRFVLVEAADGRDLRAREGVANPATQWVDPVTGTLKDRGQIPGPDALIAPADGATAVTWSGLPNPTHVEVWGTTHDEFDVTDGELLLTFDAPGRWLVRLNAGPAWMPREDRIDAT